MKISERNWLGPACVETSAGRSAGGPATIPLRSKCGVKIPPASSPLEFTPHNPEGICAGTASPCLPADTSVKEGLPAGRQGTGAESMPLSVRLGRTTTGGRFSARDGSASGMTSFSLATHSF